MNASLRPGISSARAPREVTEAVAAKAEFRESCILLGLTLDNGSVSKMGAARYLTALGYFTRASVAHESTVRGWLNPYALNRRPPEKALTLLREKAAEKRVGGDAWLSDVALALSVIR